jgi:A/G-specific adenine glycosylase
VPPAQLDAAWPDATQRSRALASLITDGLAERHSDGGYALPAHPPGRRLQPPGG